MARCRRLLDLDADPVAVDATLAADPALAPAVAEEPGVRVPRAVDGFEMAVRAIVGQQISVAGARTTLARLARRRPVTTVPSRRRSRGNLHGDGGGLPRAFPARRRCWRLPDEAFGMPAARRETLRALARAVADGDLDLDPGADRAETGRGCSSCPASAPWTAGYVAMRALGDPDVFLAHRPRRPPRRRRARPARRPDHPRPRTPTRWAPWRSYADDPTLESTHDARIDSTIMDTPAGPFTHRSSTPTARCCAAGFTADAGGAAAADPPEPARRAAARAPTSGRSTAAVRAYLDGDLDRDRRGAGAAAQRRRVPDARLAGAARGASRATRSPTPEFAALAGRPAGDPGRRAGLRPQRRRALRAVPPGAAHRRQLGGFRWGLDVKRWLLGHERR